MLYEIKERKTYEMVRQAKAMMKCVIEVEVYPVYFNKIVQIVMIEAIFELHDS